ncbi:MAG TPA: type II toxin-antitoxin system VapC family toxin [Chitinophagaceae bacterium]|nr:type II toxin-antitoxin system VapC family toxin [Chitinophagaceae bacterium]
MVLCDTNIFIELFRNNQSIVKDLEDIKPENICTSVVCVAELYFGAFDRKELNKIQKDISGIKFFQIEPDISNLALQLMHRYILAHKVAYPDFLIAASCLHYDLELYTLNKKDFSFIPGIKFYK